MIKGKLNKKRPFDSPPISAREFWFLSADGYSNVCKDDEYGCEYDEWVDRQARLDGEGFQLLADHYRVDRDAPDLMQQVAIHICRDFVPFFMMNPSTSSKRRTDKQNSWTALSRQLALVRVKIELWKSGSSKTAAMDVVAKKYYSGAELRSQVNTAENFHDFGEYIKDQSIDELNRVEKSLIKFNKMAQLEHEIWSGNADDQKLNEFRALQNKMEKHDLVLRQRL